jgi:multidrug efflux system outer membrane protein
MLRFAKHLAGALSVFLVGCSVGPNYKRPLTNLPQSFRGTPASDIGGPASSASLADQQWSAIFQDPVLQRLVTEALQNNLDLHIAAQRVLEAQAQVGITRSQQFPSVNAGGSYKAAKLKVGLCNAFHQRRTSSPLGPTPWREDLHVPLPTDAGINPRSLDSRRRRR